jgi:hypothetical protein
MIPLSYFILHNLGSTSTVVSATQRSFIGSIILNCLMYPHNYALFGLLTTVVASHFHNGKLHKISAC